MNGLRETSPILALKQGEKPLQPVFIGVKHLCIQKNSTFAPHFRILSRNALKSIGVADGSALYRGKNCQIHSESPGNGRAGICSNEAEAGSLASCK